MRNSRSQNQAANRERREPMALKIPSTHPEVRPHFPAKARESGHSNAPALAASPWLPRQPSKAHEQGATGLRHPARTANRRRSGQNHRIGQADESFDSPRFPATREGGRLLEKQAEHLSGMPRRRREEDLPRQTRWWSRTRPGDRLPSPSQGRQKPCHVRRSAWSHCAPSERQPMGRCALRG